MNDFRYVENAASTMDEVRLFLSDPDSRQEVAGVYTFCQYAGRGSGENRWFCGEGENVALSVGIRPEAGFPVGEDTAKFLFCLNMVLSLGALDYVRARCRNVCLKWPNDLYIGERKLGGVLIENRIFGGEVSGFCYGIGWNVNQRTFPEDLPNPVSIIQNDGKVRNLHEEASDMFLSLKNAYWDFKKILFSRSLSWTFSFYKATYIQNLFAFGRWRNFIYKGVHLHARIVDVDSVGHLVLESSASSGRIFADVKELEYCLSK